MLGLALADRRHEAVIAGKVNPSYRSGREIQQACERSLQRLNTDYIDLYQLHWPNPQIPPDETMEALQTLLAQGKVRSIGVSNFGVADLSDLLAFGRCATNQMPYSLLWRAIEYRIMPKCLAEGVGVLCYSPLLQGLLTGKFSTANAVPDERARTRHFSKDRPQTRHGEAGCEVELFATLAQIRRICDRLDRSMVGVAIAWLLRQPGVTSVIAGARSPDQIKQNAQAANLALAPEIVDELTRATNDLKHKLGPNPDLWQSESRIR